MYLQGTSNALGVQMTLSTGTGPTVNSGGAIFNRINEVIHKFPELIKRFPDGDVTLVRRGRKSKVPNKSTFDSWRIAQTWAQHYPGKLDRILNAPSIFEYIRTYREVLDQPKFRKEQTYGEKVIVHNGFQFYTGYPRWDFSKKKLLKPRPNEIAKDSTRLYVYLEKRLIIRMMNLCVFLARTHNGKPDYSRLSLGAIFELNNTALELPVSKVKSAPASERVSAYQLFTDNGLLKSLLYKWDYFLLALRIEPCLLQTDFGLNSAKHFPLWLSESRKELARSLSATEDFEHAGVMRALLLIRGYEADLFDGREISKELLGILESKKLVSRKSLTIGSFRKIYFRTLHGEAYSKQ
jgi:hypothetical protein